jgi:hypothetical protein
MVGSAIVQFGEILFKNALILLLRFFYMPPNSQTLTLMPQGPNKKTKNLALDMLGSTLAWLKMS